MALILITANSYFPDFPGGTARIAYDLAHGLAKSGHRIYYLCQDISRQKPSFELDNGVSIIRYKLSKQSKATAPLLHYQHIRAAIMGLRRYLPTRPDVIQGNDLLQYVAARRVYGVKVRGCYTVHSPCIEELKIVWRKQGATGYIKTMLGIPVIRRLEREVLEQADALIVLSGYMRSLLGQLYGNQLIGRILIIPGWADVNRFHPLDGSCDGVRKLLAWPQDRTVFFSLRRLESRMGLDNLLYAYDIIRKANENYFGAIAGTGSQLAKLLELRTRLGLEKHVSIMGHLSDDTIPLAYGACDASVIPTVELEGFGLIALEAAACGKPVLATPVGALPEVVGSFEPKWIAQSSSPRDLAELLIAFLREKLPIWDAQRLYKYVSTEYSFEKALQSYKNALGINGNHI